MEQYEHDCNIVSVAINKYVITIICWFTDDIIAQRVLE